MCTTPTGSWIITPSFLTSCPIVHIEYIAIQQRLLVAFPVSKFISWACFCKSEANVLCALFQSHVWSQECVLWCIFYIEKYVIYDLCLIYTSHNFNYLKTVNLLLTCKINPLWAILHCSKFQKILKELAFNFLSVIVCESFQCILYYDVETYVYVWYCFGSDKWIINGFFILQSIMIN